MTPVEPTTVFDSFKTLPASITDGFRVLLVGPAYDDGPVLNASRANTLDVVTTEAEIAALYASSTLSSPETGLPFAAARALSPGVAATPVEVLILATAGTAAADYETALTTVVGDQRIAWVVPLSTDTAVLAKVASFVTAMQTVDRLVTPVVVIDSPGYTVESSGSAAVSDTGGSVYTTVTDATGTFVTDGVAAGDLFVQGANQALVDAVNSETELVLASSFPAAVTPAVAYEVRRTQTASERVASYSLAAGSLADGTVAVWPPAATWDGAPVGNPALLASAVGGQLGWTAQHQLPKNVALDARWASSLSAGPYAGAIDALDTLPGLWVLRETGDNRLITRAAQTNDVSADQEAYVHVVAIRELARRRILADLDAASIVESNQTAILRSITDIVDRALSDVRSESTVSALGAAYSAYTIDEVVFDSADPAQVNVTVTLFVTVGFRVYAVTVNASVI